MFVSTLLIKSHKKEEKSNSDFKDKRKHATKVQEDNQSTSQYKTFKSKMEGLEDAIFESGAMKHVTQFTKMLKEIADYVQIKYSSNAVWMIRDVECPNFSYPAEPVGCLVTSEERKTMWKKD